MHAEHHRGLGQRRRHVVAVADVREGSSGERAETLLQREQVRNGLTRMLFVRQCIDDMKARRCGRKRFQARVRERSDDDTFDPDDTGDQLSYGDTGLEINNPSGTIDLALSVSILPPDSTSSLGTIYYDRLLNPLTTTTTVQTFGHTRHLPLVRMLEMD